MVRLETTFLGQAQTKCSSANKVFFFIQIKVIDFDIYVDLIFQLCVTLRAPILFLSYGKIKNDYFTFELPCEKTNNVVFEQVRHKLVCTVTEDLKFWI